MIFLLMKVLVSAVIIGGINLMAKINPQFAGWVSALPIVSLMSVIWLAAGGATQAEMSIFVGRVILGLFPTAGLLCIVSICLGRGLPLSAALGCAASAWVLFTIAARKLGLLA
jgi:hypothetical protein